jgi:hypothetical protein
VLDGDAEWFARALRCEGIEQAVEVQLSSTLDVADCDQLITAVLKVAAPPR